MARKYTPRGETRGRVLDSALALFADHGFSGTSLQMIADHVGVSKAAVYQQFRTKEDMLLALMEPAMERLAERVEDAESQRGRGDQVSVMFDGLVDLVLEFRLRVGLLRADPGIQSIVNRHPEMSSLVSRLQAVLLGPDPSVNDRVTMAVMGSGIMAVGADPALSDIDDEDVRREMRAVVDRAVAFDVS
ncbi:TetR/AcrR family transcriptional regulator [Demequina sp. NBRC 110054]|uniref:TetR/AcrR family transcriptional regulator n=1 Tax=Demequina sp. NBRC 110054 TaxID=1570343 RepID=UPI001356637C|nr:TetR/AcrR family transcriptional regulator [Demequina sp. NBRC 110054]